MLSDRCVCGLEGHQNATPGTSTTPARASFARNIPTEVQDGAGLFAYGCGSRRQPTGRNRRCPLFGVGRMGFVQQAVLLEFVL